MSAQQANDAPVKPSFLRRRFLWEGVLPEALGLCFVVIIFGGFAVGYLVVNYSWKRQALATQRTEAESLVAAIAAALTPVADAPDGAAETTLQNLVGGVPQLRSLKWTGVDGSTRFAWPPTLPVIPGVSASDDAESAGAPVTAAVSTSSGASAGTLRLVHAPPADGGARALLFWNWGVAAAVTLIVFTGFYYSLRYHLRPVAAIERNLHSYAEGIEQELTTLTLSDSLGAAARGWNRLVGQLAEARRQLQNANQGSGTQDVLARFESAVFRRVVDRLPHGVLWVGDNERVRYSNGSAAALLGHARDQLTGRPAREIIDAANVLQAIAVARGRGGAGVTVDHTREDGEQEYTLRFRVVPMSEQGTGSDALVTIEDISQLREGQRARDNFLYHVTHELRTPLTNIHAYVETLTQPGFDDEQTRKECYNVLISETERLSRLVEDILSISQLEVGTARLDVGDVDLVRLVRQMVQDNLGAADEKRIDLTLTLPPKVPKIRGDKQRLSVLLNNLLGNAVKYTPENGKVHVNVEADQQRLLISVSDTGIGIAPEEEGRVFEKFYRAADDVVQQIAGTGLGLALAREVARLHGGDIYLESELGKGSTFTIELPLPAAAGAEVSLR